MATVLVTGATGHIGAAVVIKALEDGYAVRAAVRSQAKAGALSGLPAVKGRGLDGRLTFAEVPDILADHAYDEAAKGAEFVIHIASPLMSDDLAKTDWQETIVRPAVDGTTNVLRAAKASGSVRRVVITSSVVANINPMDPTQSTSADVRRGVPPKMPDMNVAYLAAKRAALAATDKFVEEHAPQFDVVNLMPAYVVGRKELATSVADMFAGSNGFAFALVTRGPIPANIWTASCHIDDVARLHVDSLKLPGKQTRNFGISANFDPNAVFDIVKARYPAAVDKGIIKEPSAKQEFHGLQFDCSETEKAFGFKFKPIEDQIDAVMGQLMEILASKS